MQNSKCAIVEFCHAGCVFKNRALLFICPTSLNDDVSFLLLFDTVEHFSRDECEINFTKRLRSSFWHFAEILSRDFCDGVSKRRVSTSPLKEKLKEKWRPRKQTKNAWFVFVVFILPETRTYQIDPESRPIIRVINQYEWSPRRRPSKYEYCLCIIGRVLHPWNHGESQMLEFTEHSAAGIRHRGRFTRRLDRQIFLLRPHSPWAAAIGSQGHSILENDGGIDGSS